KPRERVRITRDDDLAHQTSEGGRSQRAKWLQELHRLDKGRLVSEYGGRHGTAGALGSDQFAAVDRPSIQHHVPSPHLKDVEVYCLVVFREASGDVPIDD